MRTGNGLAPLVSPWAWPVYAVTVLALVGARWGTAKAAVMLAGLVVSGVLVAVVRRRRTDEQDASGDREAG